MQIQTLREKIDFAKKCASETGKGEYNKEIFTAVLVYELMNTAEINLKQATSLIVADKKQLSIKEFLIEKKPKNDVEKVLFMGYFLEKFQSQICFNIDDMKNAFVKSKEPLPININDKINLNIRKGYITEYPEKKDSKKAYHLTATGERVAEGVVEEN